MTQQVSFTTLIEPQTWDHYLAVSWTTIVGVYFYPRTQICSFLKWRDYTKEGEIFTILPLIIIITIVLSLFFGISSCCQKWNGEKAIFSSYYYFSVIIIFFVSVKISLQSYYEWDLKKHKNIAHIYCNKSVTNLPHISWNSYVEIHCCKIYVIVINLQTLLETMKPKKKKNKKLLLW